MKKVTIKHITKIEGHATFWGALKKGNIAEAKYHTLEGARLIEGVNCPVVPAPTKRSSTLPGS